MKDKSQITPSVMQRFLAYIRPHWRMFTLGIIGTAAFAMVDAGAAYVLKPLINRGFIEKDSLFIHWIPFIVLAAFILRGLANILSTYCMTWVARTVILQLRQEVFMHFLRLPARFFSENTSGKLLSKLLYDTEQVAQVSTDALTTFVQSACSVLGLLIVMFVVSWQLSALFFLTAPLMVVIVRLTNRRIRRISHEAQHVMGQVTEIATESIEGYRVVRAYAGQEYENRQFVQATDKSRYCDMKVVMNRAYCISGVQVIAAATLSVIVNLAINPAYTTLLTAGEFASVLVAMVALLKPLKDLTKVNADIQKGLTGAKSIFHLLDQPLENDQGTKSLTQCEGKIEYRSVNFTYDNTKIPALCDVTFTAMPGETVAIVGRSGGGKSTLMSLLLRFYEPTSGAIYIDNINMADLTLAELRKQIALVTQDVILFNGSIAENIAYGCLDKISEKEIIQAAEAANAMEFIRFLPQGLQTVVGEHGNLLSGGQRQRIALARAILKKAPILILDEATAALDSEAESKIQEALVKVMENRTTLIIAHRLSTIEKADKIIVLDKGKIVEMGSHQELLRSNGHYAKLHALQFGHSSLSTINRFPLSHRVEMGEG